MLHHGCVYCLINTAWDNDGPAETHNLPRIVRLTEADPYEGGDVRLKKSRRLESIPRNDGIQQQDGDSTKDIDRGDRPTAAAVGHILMAPKDAVSCDSPAVAETNVDVDVAIKKRVECRHPTRKWMMTRVWVEVLIGKRLSIAGGGSGCYN